MKKQDELMPPHTLATLQREAKSAARRLARSLNLCREAEADICQDLLADLLSRLHRFDPDRGTLGAFAGRIVANQASCISLSSLNRLSVPKPPRIVIYGPHGIGKNSFAGSAPRPVLINIEDGHPTGQPIDAFPKAEGFQDVMDAMAALYAEKHDFETLVVDSLDWLEPLVWAETVRRNNVANPSKPWASIEDAGYGRGFVATLEVWREYLDAINALRNDKGMAVIQTAHAEVKRFDSPETEPFDRYQIKLHKLASALVQEHADMVLFANFKTSVTRTDVGMKKVVRGVGAGTRALYTEERPAFLAKNRHNLPSELPLSWEALASAMAASSAAARTSEAA